MHIFTHRFSVLTLLVGFTEFRALQRSLGPLLRCEFLAGVVTVLIAVPTVLREETTKKKRFDINKMAHPPVDQTKKKLTRLRNP